MFCCYLLFFSWVLLMSSIARLNTYFKKDGFALLLLKIWKPSENTYTGCKEMVYRSLYLFI